MKNGIEAKKLQEIIETWGVILYPTDTIRGLGCDAENEEAVGKIFSIKRRPKEKSLIVLMSSEEMLSKYGVVLTAVQKSFLESANKPTTMILDGVQWLAPGVYKDDGTIGVRIVSLRENNAGAEWCHNFIETCGKPLVSTSANIAGEQTPHVLHEIVHEIVDAVDGYPTWGEFLGTGESSQIVRIDTTGEVTILRP